MTALAVIHRGACSLDICDQIEYPSPGVSPGVASMAAASPAMARRDFEPGNESWRFKNRA
jgi:hypothetical protein